VKAVVADLPIHISPVLDALLKPALRAKLLADFKHWKGPAAGQQTAVFGRDVLNNGSKYLRHAHMVPQSTGPGLVAWTRVYDRNTRHGANQDQLSDRYLFYAFDKTHGFLLLYLIEDPGGHDVWTPKYAEVLSNWEELAEDFALLGILPG
jgi:hypothetical protein